MWLLAALACRSAVESTVPTPIPTTPAPTTPVEDPGVGFDTTVLLEVSIAMDSGDFAALRAETRDAFAALGGDCTNRAFESPFTWFEADVTVDGRSAERVGVRKKGFLGSLSEEKPSLKVDLDRFVDGQSFGDTRGLTLNNQLQDPALVRTCLAYELFDAAGVPAPRCAFARVEVNGEDLGVYAHVEAVESDFLVRHFGSSDGHLYEGTLADFREGFTSSFEAETDATDPSLAPLQPLIDALASPDDGLLDALEPVLDIDAFLRFQAAETLLVHVDGYTMNLNNFYVYVDPADGRARFVPWGADQVLLPWPEGATIGLNAELARRLHGIPEIRARFALELQRQLDGVYDEDALHARIDAFEALIAPAVADPLAVAAELDALRAVVDGHRAAMQAVIDALPSEVPPPSEPLCLAPIGTVTWSFDTAFDGDLSEITAGGQVEVVLDGTALSLGETVSAAGFGEGGDAVVTTIGSPGEGLVGQIVVGMDPARLTPGAVPIDLVAAEGYFLILEEATEIAVFQGFLIGDIELGQAGTTDGDPVVGSLVAEVYAF